MRIEGRRWSMDIGYVCCWDARGVAVVAPQFYFDMTFPPIPWVWSISEDVGCTTVDSSAWTGRQQTSPIKRAWWRWRPDVSFWRRG